MKLTSISERYKLLCQSSQASLTFCVFITHNNRKRRLKKRAAEENSASSSSENVKSHKNGETGAWKEFWVQVGPDPGRGLCRPRYPCHFACWIVTSHVELSNVTSHVEYATSHVELSPRMLNYKLECWIAKTDFVKSKIALLTRMLNGELECRIVRNNVES